MRDDFCKDMLEALLELEGIEEIRKDWGYYNYDNISIPRVTHILQQCDNQEGLIQWAANVGRKKYDYFRQRALDIGTITHAAIDDYIVNHLHDPFYRIDYDSYYQYDPSYKQSIDTAFNNFKIWLDNMEKLSGHELEVIGVEIPVTCPWFGGTIDAIFKIGDQYYVIDFKTSKAITLSYLLQTSAYMWCINNGYAPALPHIDGIGIIRVDKSKTIIDDLFLNYSNINQRNDIDNYMNCFISYINAYYRSKSCEFIFDNYNELYFPGEYNYGNNK